MSWGVVFSTLENVLLQLFAGHGGRGGLERAGARIRRGKCEPAPTEDQLRSQVQIYLDFKKRIKDGFINTTYLPIFFFINVKLIEKTLTKLFSSHINLSC